MNTPWRVSENAGNSRVCILGADGRVMTEIIPGQVHGMPVTQEERVQIAYLIMAAVNRAAWLVEQVGAMKEWNPWLTPPQT